MLKPNFLLKMGFLINFVFAISIIAGALVVLVTLDEIIVYFRDVLKWFHESTMNELRIRLICGIVLVGFMLPIASCILSIKAYKNPKFKILAAITSVIYSIIPGIMIFLGDYEQDSQN